MAQCSGLQGDSVPQATSQAPWMSHANSFTYFYELCHLWSSPSFALACPCFTIFKDTLQWNEVYGLGWGCVPNGKVHCPQSPGGNLTSEVEEGQWQGDPSKEQSAVNSSQLLTWRPLQSVFLDISAFQENQEIQVFMKYLYSFLKCWKIIKSQLFSTLQAKQHMCRTEGLPSPRCLWRASPSHTAPSF